MYLNFKGKGLEVKLVGSDVRSSSSAFNLVSRNNLFRLFCFSVAYSFLVSSMYCLMYLHVHSKMNFCWV